MLQNTICAVATPPGEGGISVIRISGDAALAILQKVFVPAKATLNQTENSKINATAKNLKESAVAHSDFRPKPRYLHLGQIKKADTAIIDEVLAVYMPAPHSYTGEDVVEIQCHGGYVVTKEIINALLSAGAIMAEPGEFTQRAFINGRLNLTQAEAIIDIIEAKSAAALRISEKQLANQLGKTVMAQNEELLDILAQIEVAVDYPEEETDIWHQLNLSEKLTAILAEVNQLLKTADDGKIYRDGMLTAIVGPTNAGKSTLLNALLCEDRAIVTDIAGTTRDTVEEYLNIDGVPIRLADTAGIRQTEDIVEAAGIRRSQAKIAEAQLILLVWDIQQPLDENWRNFIYQNKQKPLFLLLNKMDTADAKKAETVSTHLKAEFPRLKIFSLSAKNQQGIENLKTAIYQTAVSGKVDRESMLGLVNDRQKSALLRAAEHLTNALTAYESGIDGTMIAIDIQSAWEALAEITGGVTSDDIINRVFSRFCLGK